MPDYLTIDQAATYLQMSRGSLAQLRYLGKGPKYIALTKKAIRYRPTDIDAWADASERAGTAVAA